MSIFTENISGHDDQLRPGWDALWALDDAQREAALRRAVEFRELKIEGTRDIQAEFIDRLAASPERHLVPVLNVLDHIGHLWIASQFTAEEVIDDLATLGLLPSTGEAAAREFLREFFSRWPGDPNSAHGAA